MKTCVTVLSCCLSGLNVDLFLPLHLLSDTSSIWISVSHSLSSLHRAVDSPNYFIPLFLCPLQSLFLVIMGQDPQCDSGGVLWFCVFKYSTHGNILCVKSNIMLVASCECIISCWQKGLNLCFLSTLLLTYRKKTATGMSLFWCFASLWQVF